MLDFPIGKIQYALFKGIELEGPLQGHPTLFVVGDVPLLDIYSALYENSLYNIYFGAGGRVS